MALGTCRLINGRLFECLHYRLHGCHLMKLPEPRQPGAGRSDLDSVGGNRGVSQNKKKGGRAGGAPPPTRKNSGIKTPNEPRKIYVTILPLCGGMSPLTLTLKLLRGGGTFASRGESSETRHVRNDQSADHFVTRLIYQRSGGPCSSHSHSKPTRKFSLFFFFFLSLYSPGRTHFTCLVQLL